MRRCSVKPYEGNEGYVFISYSHGDKDRVYPILERMAADGCRLWYDEGITPGEEWPEAIGRHLSDCSAFISFVSKRSADSDNCRREIIFAQRKHKPFFSVILEEFELSPGLEMQLSAYQSLYMYLLRDEDEFFEKFYKTDFADCFRTISAKPEKAPAPETAAPERPAGLSVDGRMFTAKKTVITADSFRKLSEKTNLKFVKIESCTFEEGVSFADLEGIANCTKLTLLALNGNELTDAGVLKKSSSSLKSADLRNNKLKDLSFITDAPDLSLLYADGNMIEDISALRGAPGLVTFTAAHNRIGDISALSGCAKLRTLVLSDNAVSDASALAGLPDTGDKMLKVMLGNNSLTGIDLGDKEINVLYISGNPISGGALNCRKCRYLFAGYSEDMDPEKLFAGDKISHMYLSGCPLDRQVEFKQASRSAMVTLEFVETEQELTALADQFFSQYASGGIDAFSLTGRDG